MRTYLPLTILFVVLNGLSLFAQQGPPPGVERPGDFADREMDGERAERVKEARRTFLIERMQLTEAEARDFIPMLEAHENEMRDLARTRKKGRNDRAANGLDEGEARAMIEEQLTHEENLLKMRRDATRRFLEVLPATKLVRLESAKRDFRKELMSRMRDRRDRRQPQGRRAGRQRRN